VAADTAPPPPLTTLTTAPTTGPDATTARADFDWTDAGIGAAGGIAISLIVLGGGRSAAGADATRVSPTATNAPQTSR
jgi:hypothetical protein